MPWTRRKEDIDDMHLVELHLGTVDFSEEIATIKANFTARKWLEAEIKDWLLNPQAPRTFWLTGKSGVGKSYVAVRVSDHFKANAWHLAHHDEPQHSRGLVLFRSLATMLANSLPGFREALDADSLHNVNSAAHDDDYHALFEAYLREPLLKTSQPSNEVLLVIDAIDELPRAEEFIKTVLIDGIERLPHWVRFFVTSRSGSHNDDLFRLLSAKYPPTELRADDERNLHDIATFARQLAFTYCDGHSVGARALEADAKHHFFPAGIASESQNIFLDGKLDIIELDLQRCRDVYDKAIASYKYDTKFQAVAEFCMNNSKYNNAAPRQTSDDFELVYSDACLAQDELEERISDAWEPVARIDGVEIRKPTDTDKFDWIDQAISAGVSSRERAQDKLRKHGGGASQLTNLARLTLRYDRCDRLLEAIGCLEEDDEAPATIIACKNTIGMPTLTGYRSIVITLDVPLKNGRSHLCEIELVLSRIFDAQHDTQPYFDEIRTQIPKVASAAAAELLSSTTAETAAENDHTRKHHNDTKKALRKSVPNADDIEIFLLKRLTSSSLEGCTDAICYASQGLMLYMSLLRGVLSRASKRADATLTIIDILQLPQGLNAMFVSELNRAFASSEDDHEWEEHASEFVALCIAAREPIPVSLARYALSWMAGDEEKLQQKLVNLFPVRHNRYRALHRSVIDFFIMHDNKTKTDKSESSNQHSSSWNGAQRFVEYVLSHNNNHHHSDNKRYKVPAAKITAAHTHLLEACFDDLYPLLEDGKNEAIQLEYAIRNFGEHAQRVLEQGDADGRARDLATRVFGSLRVVEAAADAGGLEKLRFDLRSMVRCLEERKSKNKRNHHHHHHQKQEENKENNEVESSFFFSSAESIGDYYLCGGCGAYSDEAEAAYHQPYDQPLETPPAAPCDLLSTCTDMLHFLQAHGHDIALTPHIVYQCAANWPDSLAPARAFKLLDTTTTYVELLDKPQGLPIMLTSEGSDMTNDMPTTPGGHHLRHLQRHGHTDWVWACSFSSDGTRIATAGKDKTCRLWDSTTGDWQRTLSGHDNWVRSCAISHDGSLVVTASYDLVTRVWYASSGELKHKLVQHSNYINDCCFSPDGTLIATAAYDKTAVLWNTEAGTHNLTLKGHSGWIDSIALTSSSLVATGSWDKTIRISKTDTGDLVRVLQGHSGRVTTLDFSTDSSKLVTGSTDKTVRVWAVKNGTQLVMIEGASYDRVFSCVFSADSNRIYTAGGEDRTARVWNANDGSEIARFVSTDAVYCIDVNPLDPDHLVVGTKHSGVLRLLVHAYN